MHLRGLLRVRPKSPVDDVSSDAEDGVSTQAPPPPEVTKPVPKREGAGQGAVVAHETDGRRRPL